MSRLNRVLVAVAAAFPGLLASAALAQAPAAPAATEIKPSVTPYGLIQSKFWIVDSQRQNAPDTALWIARFGFKANYGIAVSQIELGADPSSCEQSHVYKQVETTKPIIDQSSCVPNSRLTVRRADIGLNVKVADMSTLQLSFGRIRPGGALGWGVDATNTPENYSFLDGARLGLNVDLGAGNSISGGVIYGNAMLTFQNGDNYNTRATMNDGMSNASDRAIVIGLDATVSNVKASFYYGTEKNAFIPGTKVNKKEGFVIPFDDGDGKPTSKTTVADYTHTEASLGYDMGNLAGGVFYYQHSYGSAKPVTDNALGKLELGDKVIDARIVSSIGFGINGDSTLFDVKDLLQKDDKLTYGASYVSTNDGWDKDAKAKITQVAVGFGYTTGGLGLELDYARTSATQELYKAKNGDAKKSNDLAYLSAVYAF